MTRVVDVYFETGREVLNAYWGYLSGGGLTLPSTSDPALRSDEAVTLRVQIGARRQFILNGRVARSNRDGVVVAFDTNDSHNQLLSAALADQLIDMEARLAPAHRPRQSTPQQSATPASVFQLSEDGCCVRLADENDALFHVGCELFIEAPRFRIGGCVVSARGRERCIVFGFGDDDAVQAVRACLRSSVEAA